MDLEARAVRKKKIRSIISGTKTRPRLNVFRSSKHIYAALINDQVGKTILTASEKEVIEKGKMQKQEKARLVGKILAEKALKKGLEEVVFDRAGYLYHGRVKNLAEGAREGGLKF